MKGTIVQSRQRYLWFNLTYVRNEAGYMPINDTYSPILHRLDQAVRWRAVHPNEPIPPVYEILTRFSKPPEQLVAKAKRQLEKLVAAADVKKGNSNPVQETHQTTIANLLQSHPKLNPENATATRSNPFPASTSAPSWAPNQRNQRLLLKIPFRNSVKHSMSPSLWKAFMMPHNNSPPSLRHISKIVSAI